jgi:hypothetical protein
MKQTENFLRVSFPHHTLRHTFVEFFFSLMHFIMLKSKTVHDRIRRLNAYTDQIDATTFSLTVLSDLTRLASGIVDAPVSRGGGIADWILSSSDAKYQAALQQYNSIKDRLNAKDMTYRQIKRYYDALGKYNSLKKMLHTSRPSRSSAMKYIKTTLLKDKNMLLFPFRIKYAKNKQIDNRVMDLIDRSVLSFMSAYISFMLQPGIARILLPQHANYQILKNMYDHRMSSFDTLFTCEIHHTHHIYPFLQKLSLHEKYLLSYARATSDRKRKNPPSKKELWKLYQTKDFDEQLALLIATGGNFDSKEHASNMNYLNDPDEQFPKDFPEKLLDFLPTWVFAVDEPVYPTKLQNVYGIETAFDENAPVYVYWHRKTDAEPEQFVSFVLMYCFDTGIHNVGSHVTDVEFVRVYYDDDFKAIKWFLSCHTNRDGHWVRQRELTRVWVARGTHAHYPGPGTWVRAGGVANDVCSSGVEWKPKAAQCRYLSRIDSLEKLLGGGRKQFMSTTVRGNIHGAAGRIFMPDKWLIPLARALTPKRYSR